MKQTACILVLTLIRKIRCFFVCVDIWLREKDGCMAMKRSRLQMHIYKYLGMTFTTKLCIDLCFQMYVKKKKNSQIEPMLTYAAEVWGLENVGKIEKVQTFLL